MRRRLVALCVGRPSALMGLLRETDCGLLDDLLHRRREIQRDGSQEDRPGAWVGGARYGLSRMHARVSNAGSSAVRLVVCGGSLEPDAVEAPSELRILGDGTPPREVRAALADAAALIVLDPFGFPLESLSEAEWDVPLTVCIPRASGADHLSEILRHPLLDRLTFFDRIATKDETLWRDLRDHYQWGEWQRINSSDQTEIVRAVASFHLLDVSQEDGEERDLDVTSYWRRRGELFAEALPHRVYDSTRLTLRHAKAIHRCQARALSPMVQAAEDLIGRQGRLRVLEVGSGTGRWASLVGTETADFTGTDQSAACIRVARENFPRYHFEEMAEVGELAFPDERFDLLLSVSSLQRDPQPSIRRLLEEMWRVLAPGGWLVLLEEVIPADRQGPEVRPVELEELETAIVEASHGAAILEYFEALRYPQDDLHRAALLVCSKTAGLGDAVRSHGLRPQLQQVQP